MSVAIVVSFKSPDRAPLYVPVATEALFSNAWLPAAERLGLSWVPRFELGADVPPADLPAVRAEIARVRAALAHRRDAPSLLPRVDSILDALADIDPAEVATIFIG